MQALAHRQLPCRAGRCPRLPGSSGLAGAPSPPRIAAIQAPRRPHHGAPERAHRRPACPAPHGRLCSRASADAGASYSAGGADIQLPTRLNNIPHQREVRQFFYKDVTAAILAAVEAGESRMSVRCTVPELNPEMDVFRIGTLLELCREVATALAADGARVKVCVQKAMGQGVFQGLPLSLSGVRAIMDRMDWGDAEAFVSFGHVAADQVDDASVFLLIAPQNVVGNTIMTPLLEMVEAAEAAGKHVVLINPLLKDIPSSSNVMQIRGRKERMDFADSFAVAYHFRLLYRSSAMMFPIMGALRKTYRSPWQVFKREDVGKREEEYRPVGEFERQPGGSELTPLFAAKQQQRSSWSRFF